MVLYIAPIMYTKMFRKIVAFVTILALANAQNLLGAGQRKVTITNTQGDRNTDTKLVGVGPNVGVGAGVLSFVNQLLTPGAGGAAGNPTNSIFGGQDSLNIRNTVGDDNKSTKLADVDANIGVLASVIGQVAQSSPAGAGGPTARAGGPVADFGLALIPLDTPTGAAGEILEGPANIATGAAGEILGGPANIATGAAGEILGGPLADAAETLVGPTARAGGRAIRYAQ